MGILDGQGIGIVKQVALKFEWYAIALDSQWHYEGMTDYK